MSKKRYEAKIFLDKKQKEHFKKFGVYADVNSKIAEWMQEYADIEVKKLSILVVSQQRELLEAYTQFLWTQHNNLTDADNNKLALEKFIAYYCG